MTNKEFEKLFLDLNSVLVKFWVEQGRPDKEIKIELLERMLNWYKKMGYVTLDAKSTSSSSEIPADLEQASKEYCPDDAYPFGPMAINLEVRKAFIAGAEWKDRSFNWIRDLVKAAIKKTEEAQGILERIDWMLNKEEEQ